MLRLLLGNGIRELFLNAAASSGVADFGFFGRGFWIDRLERFPATLWRDRYQAEFASHPSRNLAARPQPAIRRRLTKAQAQFGKDVQIRFS
jgi:hypothetical protein